MVLSPLIPTDQSIVTRNAYIRIPGRVFRANTSGLNADCTRLLMSTPRTNRISQNTRIRQNNGLSDRNDSYTIAGTLGGSLMTNPFSVKNFCTRTEMSAMMMAVNSPFDPNPSMENV